jgi:hypothetical protein
VSAGTVQLSHIEPQGRTFCGAHYLEEHWYFFLRLFIASASGMIGFFLHLSISDDIILWFACMDMVRN